ncbi:hypothetical protein [Agromyces sp. LHK192]|uniref:hypothetical protein n=1 Tax=Agromyces sp. LHK192 TaxID=2498704 RepID=UPI000FD84A30|nr:hypothetical protein [Agromyces sp. LHK192]
MTDAPPPTHADDRADDHVEPPARSARLRRALSAGATTALPFAIVVALVCGAAVLFGPAAAERADAEDVPPTSAPVLTAERHEASTVSLAGVRRTALATADPLRAAVRDLEGFGEAAALAEAVALLAAIDGAVAAGDADGIVHASAALHTARAALVERLVAHTEQHLAAATSADPSLLQAAHDAAAAVRSAPDGALADRFAPLRATIEAAVADHERRAAEAAAREAEADDDDWSSGGSSGGAAPGGGAVDTCRPMGIIQDDQDSMPCQPDVVVTALGAHVAACPDGTMSHVFEMRSRQVGAVTLSYDFAYHYTISSRHNVAVFHCDRADLFELPPHGPGPYLG